MDFSRTQKARLGVFVCSGMLLLVVTVALLLGHKWWAQTTLYHTRFHESVSGLENNAVVRYQGLRIGRVASMGVAADDPSAIEVYLALDGNPPLYSGTQVQLDMSGLTGLKALNLLPGDPRAPRLLPGALLPTSTSGLGHLADNASAVIADMRHIADQLGAFANPQNRERVEKLISGLGSLIGHVDTFLGAERQSIGETITAIRTTAHSVGSAADETALTLREVRGAVHGMQGQVVEVLALLREPLSAIDARVVQETLHNLHDATGLLAKRLGDGEAGRTLAAIGGTSERISHLVQDVDLAVRAGREDFSKSLSYLRQAVEDLREFSRILAQNPSVLVRGRGDTDD